MEAKHQVMIPLTIEEFTPDWLSTILGFRVDPATLSLTPNTEEQNGFLSRMLRISCTNIDSTERINLIVKLMPEASDFRDIVISMGLDRTEIQAYQTVLPALIDQVPELADYLCPFIFGKFVQSEPGPNSILVLEDLKPLGYFTLGSTQDATQSQIEDGIDFLAKLHFAGSLLEESDGRAVDKIFPFLKPNVKTLAGGYQAGMPAVFPKLLQLLSNSSQQVHGAYAALQPAIQEIIFDIFTKATECPSLVHGDLWRSNMLFNNDPSRHTKVIDWQILGYRDAVLDLAVFLISILPIPEITVDNLQNLVQAYFTLFQKFCEEKNLPHLLRRNWTEFWDSFTTIGLSFSAVWVISSIIARKDDERLIKLFEFFLEAGAISFMSKLKKN